MHAHIDRAALVLLVLMIPLSIVASGASLAGAAPGETESVTGHANFVAAGFHFSYSLSAIRHKDGSVSGQFENHVENALTGEFLLAAHVRITCFTINGNIARIGGVIERQTGIPVPPETEGFITVVDNGEGDAAPPDLASAPALGPAATHCETGFARPLFEIDRGNIQVRPSGL
jgi:hypothetical protein